MAMTTCPECGKELSNKAHACPHCGYPMKTEKKLTYILQFDRDTSASDFGSFLRICAVAIAVAGIALSIFGSYRVEYKVDFTSRGYAEKTFSFLSFITLLIPYVIDTVIVWCFAAVVDTIAHTDQVVSSMQLLQQDAETKQSIVSPVSSYSSLRQWRCPKCGAMIPTSKVQCKNCGYTRD